MTSRDAEPALRGLHCAPEPPGPSTPEPIIHEVRNSEGGPVAGETERMRHPEPHPSQESDIARVLLSQLQKGQLPKLEIPVFDGDVTKYRSFIRAFQSESLAKLMILMRGYYLQHTCAGSLWP